MSPEYLAPGVYIEEPSFRKSMKQLTPGTAFDKLVLAAKRRKASGPALTALFTGLNKRAKGTAAKTLSKELNRPLYRVDLSAVVSQYIGETEKNLRRVFASAEKKGGILFFDEADALFGKRTKVKDSHDRYANVEVGYLLQRIKKFKGVVILATNRKKNIDPAFLRRMRFVVCIRSRRPRNGRKAG